MSQENKGFIISDEDLKIMEDWLKSPEGQKKMISALEKMKPESEMERWSKNHKYAEWWAKNKNVPFTI